MKILGSKCFISNIKSSIVQFFTCSDVSIGFFSYLITVYKLEDLPGCAVLMGSVGGHIDCKINCFFEYARKMQKNHCKR